MNSIVNRWNEYTLTEQRIIAILATTVVGVCLYLYVWVPAEDYLARQVTASERAVAEAHWVAQAAPYAASMVDSGVSVQADSVGDALVTVTALHEFELANFETLGSGGVSFALNEVLFELVPFWIADLETMGLQFDAIDIQPGSVEGMVRIRGELSL